MGGKGGDDSSYTANAAANSGPAVRGMVGSDASTPTTDLSGTPVPPVIMTDPGPTSTTDTTMPTQGDDAKTPSGGDNTATPGSGASDGSGTSTGAVASSMLSAPQYWFNQPISTLAPTPIKSKLKTTSGST
ncbi:hypothetical protein QIH85_24085 [Bradyrhizobium japonicum]|uniref:hypothetical protein n=1 Tax=Bradyrhizobium japonicum TaxID=375 RepID=UPI002714B62D|nr:hypothetical protein [Bradyrhizobium japonicum]WLB24964.1 hypothetical protein QIH85_24085 [Bradyrhizobium japonicum]